MLSPVTKGFSPVTHVLNPCQPQYGCKKALVQIKVTEQYCRTERLIMWLDTPVTSQNFDRSFITKLTAAGISSP